MHPLGLAFLPSSLLAGELIASFWQGLLLVAGTAIALRLLPDLSATARSAVWTMVLLLVLCTSLLPLIMPHHVAASSNALHLAQTASVGLIWLWATASLLRLLQFGASVLRLRNVLHSAVPVATGEELAVMLRAVSRRVALCTSPAVDRPSVAGFLRPRILLPPTLLAQLSSAELSQIVLHECEHLRRRDDWVNLLQQLSLVLFPLNPALLWLSRNLSLERELACDDGVLAATRAHKAYAACLAHVAESSLVQRSVSLALGMLGRRPELVARVDRLLSAARPAMGKAQSRFATGILLAGIAGGAAMLAHCPEFVTFNTAVPATLARAELTPSTAVQVATRFIGSSMPRAMLTSAVMLAHPQPLRVQPVQTASGAPRSAVKPFRQPRPRLQPRSLLTDWRAPATPAAAPQLRLTQFLIGTEHDRQVWFTAIAWRGGWLVVQL